MSQENDLLSVSELITKRRAKSQSVQERVASPADFSGSFAMQISSFIGLLMGHQESCPAWGSPFRRAEYLERIWRNDSRISGAIFTMVSQIASLGWQITGPVKELERWYDLFAWAEETDYSEGGWTQFVKLIFTDYLTTDEGAVFEIERDEYPHGRPKRIWAMDSRRTLPGPIKLKTKEGGDKVWGLVFRDENEYKGLQKGQYHRTCSLPTPDQMRRRMGFCFMSRLLRYALWADGLLRYQEERLGNLPPEGIALVTGMTKTQLENAIAEYKLGKQQNNLKVFPGLLWLVSNVFGQELKIDWVSFREIWENFSNREAHEVFMKVIALDAGADVGGFWQVEFHGATKAASWLQHKKAQGKGAAEFIVDFERWATRIIPMGFYWRFDVPDDDQDLQVQKIKEAKIKNARLLWEPDATGERLLEKDKVLEILAEEKAIPQRYVTPAMRVMTDVMKSRQTTGRDVGTIYFPDGYIERDRHYWDLNNIMLDAPETVQKATMAPETTDDLPDDVKATLVPIIKQWGILGDQIADVLDVWEADILSWLAENPEMLANEAYWEGWTLRISDALTDAFMDVALEASIHTDLVIPDPLRNELALDVAKERMFDMVRVDGPQSIVRSRREYLDKVRGDLAADRIQFSDLESVLSSRFDAAAARRIAVSENTDIWAEAQLRTAQAASMGFKRSVRADAGRVCPTGICIEAEDAGWVPLDEEIVPGYQRPKYHPSCYCYLQFSTTRGEP